MPGGLVQLLAYGVQNVYLTGSPQMTFFKQVYRRHTNFAMEPVFINFDGNLGFDQRQTLTIPRKADLIHECYLFMRLPPITVPAGSTYAGWTNSLGHAIIEELELEIGGQLMDRHYGLWLEIWDELTVPTSQRAGLNEMLGRFEDLSELETNATSETIYYVPFKFWFNRHIGLSLPLIALQYHDVKFRLKLRPFSELVVFDGPTSPSPVTITEIGVLIDYIYLDTDERKKWATSSHSYLVEQLQFKQPVSISAGSTAKNTTVSFNHPVKELQFVFIEDDSLTNNDYFNFSRRSDGQSIMTKFKMMLHGQDRFQTLQESYFRLVQPYQHHRAISNKFIYTYSFAIEPEKFQPSGALNFSRLDMDGAQFQWVLRAGNVELDAYIYGINQNLLVITQGMAGIRFSN